MFQADDPLTPPDQLFDEPWQAHSLALADAMVKAGHFTSVEWAEALGAELKETEELGEPDTLDTYYMAVISALEHLCQARNVISGNDRALRQSEWEAAYLRTSHGQPVEL